MKKLSKKLRPSIVQAYAVCSNAGSSEWCDSNGWGPWEGAYAQISRGASR